jgi:hypothetical protein
VVHTEDKEEAGAILERLWQAYGEEHGFDEFSGGAFRKALLKHGLRVRRIRSLPEKGFFRCRVCGRYKDKEVLAHEDVCIFCDTASDGI